MSSLHLQKVNIYGATLASLLQSVLVGGQNCDGLLFGKVHTCTKQSYQDDDSDLLVTEEHQAYITSYVCFASTCSFYDGIGQVQEQKLLSLMPQSCSRDPLLGWFSFRSSSPCHPSMREAAVSQSLQACPIFLDHQRQNNSSGRPAPLLFMVVSSSHDHAGATTSMQYRTFQLQPSGPSPSLSTPLPVDTAIINLARSLGAKSYHEFLPMAPHLAAASDSSPGSSSSGSSSPSYSPELQCAAAASNLA
mmetsp:Transcript_28693/g.63184  ORF Transcript_28693/g.63184 Transcript_28693/m.63184 type:complete len:248 (+) Transcript_28693:38-781(+)